MVKKQAVSRPEKFKYLSPKSEKMRFGLIGKSLSHSFSKKFFAAKFKREGLAHTYENFELSTIHDFPQLLQTQKDLAGLNVTIPYKSEIIPYLDKISAEAAEIGAVNTIRFVNGQLQGFNTDVFGFVESLRPLLKTYHTKALVLGSGGASRAVCHGLKKLNIDYKIVSRHPQNGQLSYAQASDNLDEYRIVINTTPAGTFPKTEDKPDLRLEKVSENHLFYDLIYNPPKSRLLKEAEMQGALIKNGQEMLVLQAAKAWEIWIDNQLKEPIMESAHDNLQNADGSKEENKLNTENQKQKEKEKNLDEQSMVEESSSSSPEMVVSTDEDIPNDEPSFEEKNTDDQQEKQAPEKPEEPVEGAALVEESNKEETTMIVSDEDLEEEDEHDEIHSDEDEHDEHAEHELVIPDYAEYTPQALVAEAEKLLKNEPVQKIKAHFDSIRKNLLKQLNEERQQKLEEFLESGGVEIDFEYVQPLREKFRSIFSQYRERRQKHFNELKETLENNLKIKLNLIEQIKDIVNKEESIGDTFKEFNAIQQEWRNTGPVPRNESADLWRTYHHHVENFYEYIKINKELRDLDFKKNREAKEKLIEKAEALLENDNISDAFRELQGLHKKWKNLGPVERENREPMWERFSEATHKLHERREKHFENLRERASELIEEKKKLVEKLRQISQQEINSHYKWQESIKKVEDIRSEFRKMGRINHPENDEIWDDFRQILREFNHQKNQFYKDLKKSHQENLSRKRELVELAEKLKDSEDWRETTNEMKRIQAEWKRIGHVPKSESDKIWKQFRAACNHFFDRLTEHNKDRDKQFEGNLEAKQALLNKLQEYTPPADKQKEAVKELKTIINDWKEIGRVPRNKSQIESEFNKILDQKFKAIDLDRRESQRIRFENKMESMTDGNDDRQLTRERQQVRKQIEDAQKELNQLENNMSFFNSSSPNNPLLKEAEKNIRQHREQIELLEEKMKMLNVKIREVNKPDEEESSEEEGAGS